MYPLQAGHPLNSRFRGGPPVGQATGNHLLPIWTPHAVHLWFKHDPVMNPYPRRDSTADRIRICCRFSPLPVVSMIRGTMLKTDITNK
jgi:hypothetical protein